MDEYSIGGRDKPIIDKQQILDIVREEPPEKRIAKLIELGVLTNLEGYTWGNIFDVSGADSRFFVFANIKGVPVPLYKSSRHFGGKREDLNFFAFFGCAPNGWMIKGDRKAIDNFYGVEELGYTSAILTSVFAFDTSRRIETESGRADGYVPDGREIHDYKALNDLLAKRFDVDYSQISLESEPLMWVDGGKIAKKILGVIRNKSPDKQE